MLLGLDALADDLIAQPLDHLHDLPQERGAAGVGDAAGQEQAVQLDGVDGNVHHTVQHRIARPEIVQRGLHPVVLEGGQQPLHPVVFRDHGRFSQFDFQHPGADVVLFQNFAVALCGLIFPGQHHRGVHRNGQQPVACLGVPGQELRHLIEHIQVQFHDAADGFQNGNELVGVDDGAVGLDPAGQRLGSDDREVFGVELGLQI